MKLTWANKQDKNTVNKKWVDVVKHNFLLLYKIIDWNIANNIWLYRISSDLVPFADHNIWGYLWDDFRADLGTASFMDPIRRKVAQYINLGGRFTIHPGQYVSIGSPNADTRNNSINNLIYHGELLDFLCLPQDYSCPINIHLSNGTKGDQIVNDVYDSFSKLPTSVMQRLVFENEQNGYWTPYNIINHFPAIPITFDYHHYNLNPDCYGMDYAAEITAKTWSNNDPVRHYSEGRKSPSDPAHSDYVESIPNSEFDIEVEAKMKDLSILAHIK